MARVPKLLDVSVPLVAGMPAYPGNPEFELQPVKRIADGGSSNVSRLVMGTHTGTHVDAPQALLRRCGAASMRCRSICCSAARGWSRLPKRGGIGAEELAAAGLREDLRVLLKTPNSALWNGRGLPPGLHLPHRRRRAYLVEQGVKVVGVDYLSVEQFKKAGAPAHRALLSHGVIIIEGLNLSEASRACTRCTACRCAWRAATAPRRASF